MGAVVSNVMAKQAPPELLGIHVNLPATIPHDVAKALQCGNPPPSDLYWENNFNVYNAANISVPAAVSVFPGENYQAPRSWAEWAYYETCARMCLKGRDSV